MIKQSFTIDGYWEVIVYYDLDYNLFYMIAEKLTDIGFSSKNIKSIYQTLSTGKALAATCSNPKYLTSIVLFNTHRTKKSYINSIVHEAEHVKQAVLKHYDVEDEGEDAAYTIGYIVGQMYKGFYTLMCNCRKP